MARTENMLVFFNNCSLIQVLFEVIVFSPDTESYIQKMEKERQARQHGAQQDNRSWFQKYVIFFKLPSISLITDI